MKCINISHPEFQDLLKESGLHPEILQTKVSLWMDDNSTSRFPKISELDLSLGKVNATLKIVDALSKIQRNVYTADKVQGWVNDLQKQGVSNQQLQFFKAAAKPGMTKGEIAAAIAADYSYTVEINIAKESGKLTQFQTPEGDTFTEKTTSNKNSSYYSNLKVPGGTNYTENEIATPAITPSIKGHAEFATENGIGWFRSDDKDITVEDSDAKKLDLEIQQKIENTKARLEKREPRIITELSRDVPNKGLGIGSKTRRILEVQSDLFQKGRDKENLLDKGEDFGKSYGGSIPSGPLLDKIRETANESYNKPTIKEGTVVTVGGENYEKADGMWFRQKVKTTDNKNQFLQLLNKDNNWVTFFVKSVIQDSAKKGYEKVLFPSGDTASKIEGHTTLEEFKKQKEDRLKILEERNKKYISENKAKIGTRVKGIDHSAPEGVDLYIEEIFTQEYFNRSLEYQNNEINQLKKELERVEGPEGLAALKPIYNFYENTVTNVLNKQFGKSNITQITDEYGNTWNQLDLSSKNATESILYSIETPGVARARILKSARAVDGFIDPKNYDTMHKEVAAYNGKVGRVALSMHKAVTGKYYIVEKDYKYQLNKNANKEPIAELDNLLKNWAKTHGISVEAIEALRERFAGRYEDGILGVADLAEALIGLAENRGADTLAEEVGHFAIEILLNTPAVQRALELVVLTPEYAQVKEDYKDIYTSEEAFRKEALGKILAQAIVSTYTNSTGQNAFTTYLNTIKAAFKRMLASIFGKNTSSRKELDLVIIPLAKDILANKFMGNVPSVEEVLYSVAPKEPEKEPTPKADDIIVQKKKEFLENAVNLLIERSKILKQNAKNQGVIQVLDSQISALKREVAKGELDLAIQSLVQLAKAELNVIETALNKAISANTANTKMLVNSSDFVDMYDNIFKSFIKTMYSMNIPLDTVENIQETMDNMHLVMQRVRGKLSALQEVESIKVLEAGNLDAYGEKIDGDFDASEIAKKTAKDTTYWRLQVGNYKFADSAIIRVAHKIIFDSIARIKRFAVQQSNLLLSAQAKMLATGVTQKDLVEKNPDGTVSQYLVREYLWGSYFAAMEKHKEELATTLGFENYNEIQVEYLSKSDLAIYNNAWKNFFTTNTKKVKSTIEVAPGQVKTVMKTVPSDAYKNKEYDGLMSNPAVKEFYDLLLETRREALSKLPVKYRTEKNLYTLPTILNSHLEELSNKDKSILNRVGTIAERAFIVDEDDTEFGQTNVMHNKMVPIYFTGLIKNTKNLSTDLARTFSVFAEMAENFQEMNRISGDLGVIQKTLAERSYLKGKVTKKGIESNEYKVLETLLDASVFGIERTQLASEIPDNKFTEKLGIAGKKFSWTKASQTFSTFIRDNNLALNITTALSGWLKGSGDSIIEDQVGLYTTNESKNWSRAEFMRNISEVASQIGKSKQTNKMHLILQEAGVIDLEKIFKNSGKGRVARTLLTKDVLYIPFATGDYGLKGRATLAIYDNLRLHNGKFVTKAKFVETFNGDKKAANEAWKKLRDQSLYNAYEVVNGQLVVKDEFKAFVTDGVLNTARGKVDHLTHYIDGTLSNSDKGALARKIAGDYLLMHRGWFIGLIDTRFKKENKNFITEEEEIGTYRATADFLFNGIGKTLIKEKGNVLAALATWDKLSSAKKRGVLKTALDGFFLIIVSFLAALANMAADDDDEEDWTIQYTAYQLNRLLLEQGAAWSPAEVAQMIDEPVVGARMIKDILDLTEAFNTSEVYQKGMYAGDSHAEKWWFRKLPIKNIYEAQYPELKNNFIKQLVDSKVYELLSDEQVNGIGVVGKIKNFAADDAGDPVPAIIEYIQNDDTLDYDL